MTANLTQPYRKAEQAYRQATTPAEQLQCLERMLVELPKHKGSEKMRADLKQRISRARQAVGNPATAKGARHSHGITRQGAGRAVLIGSPNAGKSQLLASLTRATPVIADYPFSTLKPQPAMMAWQDVFVQLVDTPPLTADAIDPLVTDLIRTAEVVVLVVDLGHDDGGDELAMLLARLANSKTRLGPESRFDAENLGVTYTRTILVANKIDLDAAPDRWAFFCDCHSWEFESFLVSALNGVGLEPVRDAIYASLNAIRVYTKPPHQKPDRTRPICLTRDDSVADLAASIHKGLVARARGARLWRSGMSPGAKVQMDFLLQDGDIVELNLD